MTSLIFGEHQLEQKTGPFLCPLPVAASQLGGGKLSLDQKMDVREVHRDVLLLQHRGQGLQVGRPRQGRVGDKPRDRGKADKDVLFTWQTDSCLWRQRSRLGHHHVGQVALLASAGLDEEQFRFSLQRFDVGNFRDQTLNIPGLCTLTTLDEIVCCPMARINIRLEYVLFIRR